MIESANGVVVSLFCLHGVGWTKHTIRPEPVTQLSVIQTHCLMHIFSVCTFFLQHSVEPFSRLEQQEFLLSKRVSYGGEVVSVRRELVASKVIAAWPKVGEAWVCPILSYVDEHLRDELSHLEGLSLRSRSG